MTPNEMRALAADWTVDTGDLRNALENAADELEEVTEERNILSQDPERRRSMAAYREYREELEGLRAALARSERGKPVETMRYHRWWEEAERKLVETQRILAGERSDTVRRIAAEEKLKEAYRLVRIEHAKTDERLGELIYGPRTGKNEQIAT